MWIPFRYREHRRRRFSAIFYWLACGGCLIVVLLIIRSKAGDTVGKGALAARNVAGASQSGDVGIVTERVEDGERTDHPAAMQRRLLESVRYLASDQLEGRGLGTAGIELAANYIADEFRQAKLKTDHYQGLPFQRFARSMRIGMNGPNRLRFGGSGEDEQTLVLRRDFTPLSLSGSGEFELPAVFVGYGISAPEYGYDDYAGIDAEGKAVLVLRHEPPGLVPGRQGNGNTSSKHASLARKVTNAVAHGAAAVLFFTDTHTLRKRAADRRDSRRPAAAAATDDVDTLLAFTVRGTVPSERVPVVHVRRRRLEAMVQQTDGIDLSALEQDIEQRLLPQSRVLNHFSIRGKISVGKITKDLKNVVATLDGAGPLSDEAIVIGAHYDHLGYRNSRISSAPSTRVIYNGADDNASGVAVLMELARQLAGREQPLARRLVFVAFTAEESGLVGSYYYAAHPLVPLEATVTMLNFDMVGYLRNSRLEIFGTRTASVFESLLDPLAAADDLALLKHPDGYSASDHASFLERGVPVLHFFTGLHNRYHHPSDDYDRLNYQGMQRITSLARDLIVELANGKRRPRRQGIREGFAIGRRPDAPRASQKVSLGLTGCLDDKNSGYIVQRLNKGGLAHRSGFRQGDRIVEIGSRRIAAESDYTESISALRSGVRTSVLLWRGRVELEIKLLPR